MKQLTLLGALLCACAVLLVCLLFADRAAAHGGYERARVVVDSGSAALVRSPVISSAQTWVRVDGRRAQANYRTDDGYVYLVAGVRIEEVYRKRIHWFVANYSAHRHVVNVGWR